MLRVHSEMDQLKEDQAKDLAYVRCDLEAEADDLRSNLALVREDNARQVQELAMLHGGMATAQAELDRVAAEHNRCAMSATFTQGEVDNLTTLLASATAQCATLERELTREKDMQQEANTRTDDLHKQLTSTHPQTAQHMTEIDQLRKREHQLSGDMTALKEIAARNCRQVG